MKKVFIIPYRDREPHKAIFLNHMRKILENETDFEIVFCHQLDKREFNRGAMKNIGFLYVKKTYSEWKDITLIFHDIDYLPYKKIFDYETKKGVVTHFYGLKYAFGGIFAIKGEDFERINGFPNYWGWGFEDNKIRMKWVDIGGDINYDNFKHFTDKSVVKLDSTNIAHENRTIGVYNLSYAKNKNDKSGLKTIYNLQYNIEILGDNSKMINVTKFDCVRKENNESFRKNTTKKEIVGDNKKRLDKLYKRTTKSSWNMILPKETQYVIKKENKKRYKLI